MNNNKPVDPLKLYKAGKQPVTVWAIDLPGWLANGWSTEEVPPEPETAVAETEQEEVPPEPTQGDEAAEPKTAKKTRKAEGV